MFFSVAYFSRATLRQKMGKRALLGDLVGKRSRFGPVVWACGVLDIAEQIVGGGMCKATSRWKSGDFQDPPDQANRAPNNQLPSNRCFGARWFDDWVASRPTGFRGSNPNPTQSNPPTKSYLKVQSKPPNRQAGLVPPASKPRPSKPAPESREMP